MELMEFEPLVVAGVPPSPRCWHVAITLPIPGRQLMLVHGGFNGEETLSDAHILDFDQRKWSPLPATLFGPVL